MRTLQQIKNDIIAIQKELAFFEDKRAMLHKAHLELVSFCWFDGMEIDHDSVPTTSPNIDSIENKVKAAIIAIDMINRTIGIMERLQRMASDDYEKTFANKQEELESFTKNENDSEEKRHQALKGFQKIRDIFPAVGVECTLWLGFAADDRTKLTNLLMEADSAIASHDVQELRRALTKLFKDQATLLKRQIDEHLEPLKNEREQLKIELKNLSHHELIEKCGKPYWVEVSGSEKFFVKSGAFPIPNICAMDFISQKIESLDADVFHYKRIYEYFEEPSSMRIFGFDSREEFEHVVKKWNVTDEQSGKADWFRSCVAEIDENIYYGFSNELLPQWKAVLEKAVPILERESEEKWLIEMGKNLLQEPVIELRLAPFPVPDFLKISDKQLKKFMKSAKK